MASPKNGSTNPRGPGPPEERCWERGSSIFELLLFTVPVCLLSMVISSKLAATSSTKLRAQLRASLAAQQGALGACGGNAQLVAPWLDGKAADIATANHKQVARFAGVAGTPTNLQGLLVAEQKLEGDDSPRKVTDVSALLAGVGAVGGLLPNLSAKTNAVAAGIKNNPAFPADLLVQSQLAATNWSVNTTTLQPSGYFFKPLADRLMPEPDSRLSAGAAFVCNESENPTTGFGNDGKESRLSAIHDQLVGWAYSESGRFY